MVYVCIYPGGGGCSHCDGADQSLSNRQPFLDDMAIRYKSGNLSIRSDNQRNKRLQSICRVV